MKEQLKSSFLNSLGVLVYIAVVATIMDNGEKVFGSMKNWLGPIAFLLLFTLSALVVGSLVLGKPIMLYLDGKKKEAVYRLGATVTWLAIFTVIALAVLIII